MLMNPSSKCHPNLRHFSKVLEVKTTKKDGRVSVNLQPADKASFQSTVVVISSNKGGKAIALLAAYFFVKLWRCDFTDKIQCRVNFHSASALLMFCFLKRHNSLTLLPEEPYDFF